MKKIIYTALLTLSVGGSVLLTSCDDLLDTKSPSSIEDTDIFTNPALLEGAIRNIYTYYGEVNYRGRFTPYYGLNTDIEWYNSSHSGGAKADLPTFNALPDNSEMNQSGGSEPWSNIYSGIEKANLAIQGIEAHSNLEDATVKQLYGEALTLRAVAYVDLINSWGDVPARFEPVGTETVYIPRTDKYVIYKQLIKDLQKAQDLVAWPNTTELTTTAGRINRAFVKGFLARVCMQAAGYSLAADGTVKKSNDPELAEAVLYPIALQACKEVMAQEGISVVLKENFEDIFQDLCRDKDAAGGESLWEVPYANEPSARGRWMHSFAVRHNTVDDMTDMKSGSSAGPTPNFFFDYSVKDKRRDVTCVPYQWKDGKQDVESVKLNSWSFGKYRYEWMERKASGNDDGVNKQYMRYADVVLMRAELENALNGASAAAPYLKKIRQRAFDPADWAVEVEQYVAAASASPQTMFEAIVDERAFEFCGEMLRRADLIRWNLMKTKMDETKQKMMQLRSREGAYADLNEYLYYKRVDFTWTRAGKNTVIPEGGLAFYGLNHGETGPVPEGYTSVLSEIDKTTGTNVDKPWIAPSKLDNDKIQSIYVVNPDKRMYWPIFQVNLNANPALENYTWVNVKE